MVDVYSKMKPDVFRLQLQTVLTTYYEDIKGAVSASGCTKPKVVERKFEDQDDAADAADADADAAAAAAAANATATVPPPPQPRWTGARHPHPAGRSLLRPPALGARAGAARGRGGQGVVTRLASPKADAD